MKIRHIIIVLALGAVLIGSALFGKFNASYVCRKCGAIAREEERQIPLVFVPLYRSGKSVEATPLSRVLGSTGIAPAGHAHDWWLISGSGNGILCALGGGGHTARVARQLEVARLIEAAHRYGYNDFRDRLLRAVFSGRAALAVSVVAPYEEDRFPNRAAFAAWLWDNEEMLDGELSQMGAVLK